MTALSLARPQGINACYGLKDSPGDTVYARAPVMTRGWQRSCGWWEQSTKDPPWVVRHEWWGSLSWMGKLKKVWEKFDLSLQLKWSHIQGEISSGPDLHITLSCGRLTTVQPRLSSRIVSNNAPEVLQQGHRLHTPAQETVAAFTQIGSQRAPYTRKSAKGYCGHIPPRKCGHVKRCGWPTWGNEGFATDPRTDLHRPLKAYKRLRAASELGSMARDQILRYPRDLHNMLQQ